jgi:hypothetical protein
MIAAAGSFCRGIIDQSAFQILLNRFIGGSLESGEGLDSGFVCHGYDFRALAVSDNDIDILIDEAVQLVRSVSFRNHHIAETCDLSVLNIKNLKTLGMSEMPESILIFVINGYCDSQNLFSFQVLISNSFSFHSPGPLMFSYRSMLPNKITGSLFNCTEDNIEPQEKYV